MLAVCDCEDNANVLTFDTMRARVSPHLRLRMRLLESARLDDVSWESKIRTADLSGHECESCAALRLPRSGWQYSIRCDPDISDQDICRCPPNHPTIQRSILRTSSMIDKRNRHAAWPSKRKKTTKRKQAPPRRCQTLLKKSLSSTAKSFANQRIQSEPIFEPTCWHLTRDEDQAGAWLRSIRCGSVAPPPSVRPGFRPSFALACTASRFGSTCFVAVVGCERTFHSGRY